MLRTAGPVDLKISILGTMTFTAGDRAPMLSAAKPRQLLALLIMNPNRPVPIDKLAAELWGDTPPKSAVTTIQTYILTLRKFFTNSLAVDAKVVTKEVLVTEPVGYTLQMRSRQLDLHDFTDLAARGRLASTEGRIAEAAELLRNALDLWRGCPFADVPIGQVLRPKVRGLEEARMVALEDCIDADLRLGRHREVISELSELTGEHLFNERLHGHLMIALYRSGRRLEALEVFQRLRARMIDEVGLEPSKMLWHVHQAVLADSGLEYLSD